MKSRAKNSLHSNKDLKPSQEEDLTGKGADKGTVAHSDTSGVFKRPIPDKVWEITSAKGFIWNQVSLQETSGRPYSLCLN